MKANVITRILKSKELNDTKYSLGFRRYDALPLRVKKSTHVMYMIKFGLNSGHTEMISVFENMTEKEYINFLEIN